MRTANSKTNTETSINIILERNSQLFDGMLITSDPFHPRGHSNLFQLKSISTLDMGLPLAATVPLPVSPSKDLENICLLYWHEIPYNIDLEQETNFSSITLNNG